MNDETLNVRSIRSITVLGAVDSCVQMNAYQCVFSAIPMIVYEEHLIHVCSLSDIVFRVLISLVSNCCFFDTTRLFLDKNFGNVIDCFMFVCPVSGVRVMSNTRLESGPSVTRNLTL